MKEFLTRVKEVFPIYKEKFLANITIILIYQIVLFLLDATTLNKVLAGVLLVVFIVDKSVKKKE